jgi:hypothetical protein
MIFSREQRCFGKGFARTCNIQNSFMALRIDACESYVPGDNLIETGRLAAASKQCFAGFQRPVGGRLPSRGGIQSSIFMVFLQASDFPVSRTQVGTAQRHQHGQQGRARVGHGFHYLRVMIWIKCRLA